MQLEVDRDPLHVPWRSVLSAHLNQAERYDRAIENAHQAIEVDENHWMPYFMLGCDLRLHWKVRRGDSRRRKGASRGTLEHFADRIVGGRTRLRRGEEPSGRTGPADGRHTASDLGPRRVPPAVLGDRCGRRLVRESDRRAGTVCHHLCQRTQLQSIAAERALAETGEDDEYGGRRRAVMTEIALFPGG